MAGRNHARYHIATVPAADLVPHPSRFRVQVNKHRLIWMVMKEIVNLHGPGRLQIAMSRPCVYGVFGRPVGGLAPRHERCVGCLRCTTQYPDVVQIYPNEARERLGDSYLTPEHVDTITYEARSGRVPVRGAGFRGVFGGPGWDAMWTDMSEIVRPTRDGIHGREYISTSVDIGEKPPFLRFDARGAIAGPRARVFSIQVPFVFEPPPTRGFSRGFLTIVGAAAAAIDTLLILPLDAVLRWSFQGAHIVPVVAREDARRLDRLTWNPRLIELAQWDESLFRALGGRFPQTLVATRVPMDADLRPLIDRGARIFHLVADYHGRAGGRFAMGLIRQAHDTLVAAGVREEVTLLGGGGIVLAEHVPKAIISGLDVVTLDTALAVALQAQFGGERADRQVASVTFRRLDTDWGVQRLQNLANSWRDQLLEILGAMGLREVRRLRGEWGRCMYQADLEQEAFEGIDGYAPAR